MEQKIMLWQGLIIGGVAAVTTVILAVIQSIIKIRAEINKFKTIQKNDSREKALAHTRLSVEDVKKRKI